MLNQQNPYQYKQIDIQKIIQNPSKSRNPKFGKITNHKRTNLRFGAVVLAPETTCAATGWSSGAQRRWNGFRHWRSCSSGLNHVCVFEDFEFN